MNLIPLLKTEVLNRNDFDLSIKFKLFEEVYSMPKNQHESNITTWYVAGYEINTSVNRRNLDIILIKDPISIYVVQNTTTKLVELERNHFVSSDKNALIEMKRHLIEQQYKEDLEKLSKRQNI